MSALASCLYEGVVRHRRFAPTPHDFSYGVSMLYLDLAELDRVFDGRWLWSAHRPAPVRWKREDFLGDPSVPLDEAVRARVELRTGRRPRGAVRMLTLPRYFGYSFNPVTFYYCFEEDGALAAIVAEITNTPWKERHAYVLDLARDEGRGHAHRWRFAKDFHVSPFLPMELAYDWRFTDPAAALVVHMEDHDAKSCVFDATMTLRRTEISTASLASAFARRPFQTSQVAAAIYWQALRLKQKRVPFHEHPQWKAKPSAPTL